MSRGVEFYKKVFLEREKRLRYKMNNANEQQVGGEHYKVDGIQHWDFVAAMELNYYQGNATKYVARWRKKNGLQDLNKALHYLDKLIELVDAGAIPHHGPAPLHRTPLMAERYLKEFCNSNSLSSDEALFMRYISEDSVWQARMVLLKIIQEAKEAITAPEHTQPGNG